MVYDTFPNALDEYLQIGVTTARDNLIADVFCLVTCLLYRLQMCLVPHDSAWLHVCFTDCRCVWLPGYTSALQIADVFGCSSAPSSYARAIIEQRADEELKNTIMVAMPKLYPKKIVSDVVKNLNNPRQATRGVSIVPETNGMIDKIERQMIEEKLLLVDDNGKPLPKVVSTVNANSDSEVEEGNFDVLNKRMYVSKSLQDLDKLESMKVAPKAKIKWVIQGDENSKYYHGILNKKRSRLVIRGIFVDSIWIDYPCLVTSEFLSHFTNHFVQPYMDFPNKLSLEQQVELENNVTREEMKVAVWDCGYGTFPKGGNSSFIALILKMHDAKMVKDFRPITLIGSVYKFNAKIIANHLVVVLGDIVNEVQSAFVANEQILYGLFILNELFHCCKKKKKHTMFLRGLEQGDSLSLFLFILIMESLYISVQRVVDVVMFKGISMGPSLKLSHLFYADDDVFMGQWSDANIDFTVQVLECFYRASGLRINMKKSKLIGISVANVNVDQAAAKIGYATLKALFSYSGSKSSVYMVGYCSQDGAAQESRYGFYWFIHKKMCNDADTSFWEDMWRGDVTFKSLFPRVGGVEHVLFLELLASMEGVTLVDMKDR
nr:RNA-directed DNA polymerase, eukaryota [Tanacetum cinerariifolium]